MSFELGHIATTTAKITTHVESTPIHPKAQTTTTATQPPMAETSARPALPIASHEEGSYQLSIGNENMLGLAQPTVSVVLSEVLDALENFIWKRWIQFNYTEAEMQQAKSHFYSNTRFPGVIGCVDGTHIKIVAPKKELQHLYYNRKGFFSINAMIVCDHTMNIRYINAKNPGNA
ncbi:putative nuclease HARBI1 [Bactrocera dorsalis]|uniref:Nuclease HARBI1 n=1 Tax=Bactrocera dorsalis TaxID=27457 RepID=A0ABM3JET4_BACDO|nr:putative nuclease HARBI1 [Bactrocera dorsalis]